MKMLVPAVMEALALLLNSNGITEVPSGPLIQNTAATHYSQQCRRIKKRNGHTIVCTNNGSDHYESADYVLLFNNRIVAVIRPLIPVPVLYFGLSTTAFDFLSHLIPVSRSESYHCCFIEDLWQLVCLLIVVRGKISSYNHFCHLLK